MARRTVVEIAPAEWPPEKSLRELKKLLSELDTLQEKYYRDAEHEEEAWHQRAKNIFKRACASDSSNHENLLSARNGGYYTVYNASPERQQTNFLDRVRDSRIAVESAISDLQMSLPEPELQGVYEGGDEYAFCRDLRRLIQDATAKVTVVDPYLDEELFDLYVERLPSTVQLRILTANPRAAVLTIGRKFSSGRTNFELKVASNLHDRTLFVDDRCWVIGQSIKDAAKKKPTYIVEMTNDLMKPIYEALWNSAVSRVKS